MIVVDASALVAAGLQTPAAEAVRRHLFEPNQSLHAPRLLDVEISHAFRRYTSSRELDEERGRGALGASLLTWDRRLARAAGQYVSIAPIAA